jgi:tRNA 2-thiouridine synthesizing protein A
LAGEVKIGSTIKNNDAIHPGSGVIMSTVQINRELDVKGLNCPLPILRAKKALADMASGDVLRVVATDPGSVKDFAAFCKQTGNALLSSEEAASAFTFLISKR